MSTAAMESPRLPVIVLTGPTASGKTATALRLAGAYDLEIVNGDSRLFYRGMDIGTAKPTADERARVPHHLMDTLDPSDPMSLAAFQDAAFAVIADIHARNRLPVLVGGTQQYVSAVVEGWKIPRVPPQPELRAELEREAEEHGREALLERLRDLDPVSATKTGLNTRRIIRALEVMAITGQPMSTQQGRGAVPWDPHVFTLRLDREALHRRIDARVERMVADGFLDEVRALLDTGIDPAVPAFSAIGYRQAVAHLAGEITEAQMVTRIQIDTHRLVRQQETWLRKTGGIPIDTARPDWFRILRAVLADIPGISRYRRPFYA